MSYFNEPYSWCLLQSFIFGLTTTYLLITLWYYIYARFQVRVTKNKLTLQPYLYMIGYFLTTLLKDILQLTRDKDNAFVSLGLAYFYLFVNGLELMFVLMAFGTQLFEWQIMSSMVKF